MKKIQMCEKIIRITIEMRLNMDISKRICEIRRYLSQYLKTWILFAKNKNSLQREKIDFNLWRKKFICLVKENDPRFDELLDEFLTYKIEKISHNKIVKTDKHTPILICVIKNDLVKVKKFIEHYRRLGIKAFVFLDNNSSDGTREFLCEQRDTMVYSCKQEYSSARRIAWINRMMAYMGIGKWYLVVDSDEFVTYIGAEEHSISDLVKIADERNYKRIEGFMLDMYSKHGLFQTVKSEAFLEENSFFDKKGYKVIKDKHGILIVGGPRKRVLETEMWLSKYPLFYYSENEFMTNSHYIIPCVVHKKCPIWIAICHYKFIDSQDLIKLNEAVLKRNYSNGSYDYKQYDIYIKEKGSVSFYDKDYSERLVNSQSLKALTLLEVPFKD